MCQVHPARSILRWGWSPAVTAQAGSAWRAQKGLLPVRNSVPELVGTVILGTCWQTVWGPLCLCALGTKSQIRNLWFKKNL